MLQGMFKKPSDGSKRVLLEMSYQPPVTQVMELAQTKGWKAINGLEVLAAQGLYQFLLWTGISLPWADVRQTVVGK